MKKEFQPKEFEGENDFMHTFEGYNGNKCIMLNAKCVHSVKTQSAHQKMVDKICLERNLTELS